jgi:predicted  nucleic acid-binding Zn-ribbon protein
MENTVAKKLEALVKLQSLDSELDEIYKIRGALPDEVMDLEDELAGYQTRVEKQNQELKEIEENIEANKSAIKDAEKLIKKYEEQQMNVRNNREYDAITKEIELQGLEIQILEKRIKEAYGKIELKNEEIDATKNTLDERNKDLDTKKDELENIMKESEGDEKKIIKSRDAAKKQVEDRLLKSYEKVRDNMRNGLAVVSVKRGACGGCFNVVPPQKQAEIRDKKKIIVCEHCGRILADVADEIVVEEAKPKRRTKRTTAAKK